ncbi:uncharacterized protein [Palaemon carinicauda]|uniref:uncharacterized protein n=1 Tax=Palaemon carinicauda TaxID=392227 RepID=UPI0035B5FFC5
MKDELVCGATTAKRIRISQTSTTENFKEQILIKWTAMIIRDSSISYFLIAIIWCIYLQTNFSYAEPSNRHKRISKRYKVNKRTKSNVEWITAEVANDEHRQISFLTSLTNRSNEFYRNFTIRIHVKSCDKRETKEYCLHPSETQICLPLRKFSEKRCLFLKSEGKKSNELHFKNNSSYPKEGYQPTIIRKNWISGPRRTSLIKMKRDPWAAHSLMILSPTNKTEEERAKEPNSAPCTEKTAKIIEGRAENPQIVTFTHQWNETNKHCNYLAVLRFQNPCRNYITGEYDLRHKLRYPSEFMDDTPSRQGWESKIVQTLVPFLAFIAGTIATAKCFHLLRINQKKRITQVSLKKRKSGKHVHKTEVLLFVYANDVKREVFTMMSNLQTKTNFEIIDLFDKKDPKKLEDPIIWLTKLMRKQSTVIILVTSPLSKSIKESCQNNSIRTRPIESTGVLFPMDSGNALKANSSCTSNDILDYKYNHLNQGLGKDLHLKMDHHAIKRKEVTGVLVQDTRKIEDFEQISNNKNRLPEATNSSPNESLKCESKEQRSSSQNLREEQLSRQSMTWNDMKQCPALHISQGKCSQLTSDPLHFLLYEFFENIFRLQLAYVYRRIYQVRLTTSSSESEMEDVTPGRIYLYPDHEGELIKELRDQEFNA